MRAWFYRHPNVTALTLIGVWLIFADIARRCAERGGWWVANAIIALLAAMSLIDPILAWWRRT